jgi:hypothetical protein
MSILGLTRNPSSLEMYLSSTTATSLMARRIDTGDHLLLRLVVVLGLARTVDQNGLAEQVKLDLGVTEVERGPEEVVAEDDCQTTGLMAAALAANMVEDLFTIDFHRMKAAACHQFTANEEATTDPRGQSQQTQITRIPEMPGCPSPLPRRVR